MLPCLVRRLLLSLSARFVGAAVGVFALLPAGQALAAPAEVRVTYDSPAGCGSEQAVREEFRSLLGEDLQGDPFDVVVAVKEDAATLVLEFRASYRGAASERTLQVEDCESAVAAAAVLMLLIVDPLLAAGLEGTLPGTAVEPIEPEPSTPAPLPSPVLEERPPRQEILPTTRPTRRRGITGSVSVGPSLSAGATPGMALGGAAEGGLGLWPVDVVLGIGGHWSLPTGISGVPAGELAATLLNVRARVQWRLQAGLVECGPYAGVGVERGSVTATGVSTPGSGATQWTSARAGAFVDHRITDSWGMQVVMGGTVPFQRPRYRLDGVGVVHRPTAVGFELLLGTFWRWGSQS